LKFKPKDIRLRCRCALCIDELTQQRLINEDKINENIKPTKLIPKGNNAIAIVWSDGHRSSIYPYKMIFDEN
jgi:ATP-binding protein involved in chromosome partitioning